MLKNPSDLLSLILVKGSDLAMEALEGFSYLVFFNTGILYIYLSKHTLFIIEPKVLRVLGVHFLVSYAYTN